MKNSEFLKMLEKICNDYDSKAGRHPESEYEGAAIFNYAEYYLNENTPPEIRACVKHSAGDKCSIFDQGFCRGTACQVKFFEGNQNG